VLAPVLAELSAFDDLLDAFGPAADGDGEGLLDE
jgi:hypothetical protein